ncbi:MAG: ArsR/SmtB family transcription factor [Micrococcaceae bacterium]
MNTTITDPSQMRALAHEVRLEALDELYATSSPRTATQLAARCGVTAPAMSYHLRVLEKYGFIERAEESADGREKLWRPVGTELVLRPEAGTSGKFAIVDRQFARQRRRITDELTRRALEESDSDAPRTPVLTNGTVKLAEVDRAEFMSRMYALIDEFEDRSRARRDDDEVQRVYYLVSLVAEHAARTALADQSEPAVQAEDQLVESVASSPARVEEQTASR